MLYAAHPYAGSDPKSVASGSYACRNFFFSSSRKAKGMRRPSSACATTRYVRGAPAAGSASVVLEVGVLGESAM